MPTKPTTPRLEFGYERGLPDDIRAAWGSRAIYLPDGTLDLIYDRRSVTGPRPLVKVVADALADGGMASALKTFQALHEAGLIAPNLDREVVIHDDLDGLIVKANPQASCGHVYLVAYMQVRRG